MTRAAFLDRDGTLNAEVSFVRSPDQLQVLPGAAAAVARLRALGFLPIVLTNQSGIARGFYTEADLARVHARLHAELGQVPAGYLHCPHLPDATGPYGGICACRKPRPGLLHEAQAMFGVHFAGSVLIGDSARDLLAGRDLPLRRILVRSGKPWAAELAKLAAEGCPPDHVAADLPAAVDWLAAGGTTRGAPPSGS